MLRPLALATFLLTLGGCASVQPRTLSEPEGRTLVNERAAQQQAEIVLADGTLVEAEALRVGADSLTWLDPETREARAVAFSEAESVSFYTSRADAGAAIGFAAGAMGAFLLANDEGVESVELGLAGLLGGAVGYLSGVDRTNRDVYHVE